MAKVASYDSGTFRITDLLSATHSFAGVYEECMAQCLMLLYLFAMDVVKILELNNLQELTTYVWSYSDYAIFTGNRQLPSVVVLAN